MPFSFTATADCEVTISMSHTASLDDNYGPQELSYYINGAVIFNMNTRHQGAPYRGGSATATHTRMIPLSSGEQLTIYLTGGMPSDTFTNISAHAVPARAAGFEFLSYSTSGANAMVAVPTSTPNGFTLTGTGTLADPFIFPTTLITSQPAEIIVRALRSGTFYFSGASTNNSDDNDAEFGFRQVRITGEPNNGQHWYNPGVYDTQITGINYQNENTVRWNEGDSGTRSFTIVKNRNYRTYWRGVSGNNITNLKFWAT
jgi:hypothetical protein